MDSRKFNKIFREKEINKTKIYVILISALIIAILIGSLFFRFDFESGSHKITPTACDTDFFGNYKVYYKTSGFEKDIDEKFYYIEKGNTELADIIKDCIANNKTVMVTYEKYIGFKGFGAPDSSPITKIQVMD